MRIAAPAQPWAWSLAALLAAGLTSPAPSRAAALAPGSAPSAPSPAPGGAPFVDGAELVRRARSEDPAVVAASAALRAAEADARTAGLLDDPELEARVLTDADGALSGEGALTLSLPLSRRRGAARELANAEVRGARLELELARHAAELRARRGHLRLEHARASATLLEATAGRAEQHAELVRAQRAAGVGDALDAPMALADSVSARRAARAARAAAAALAEELRLAAGLPSGTGSFGPAPLQWHSAGGPDPLAGQPPPPNGAALSRARAEIERAELSVALADTERAPALRLGPALAAEGGAASVGVQLAVDLPVLGSGGRRHRASLAKLAAARAGLQSAERSVRAALAAVHLRLARIDAALEELSGEVGPLMRDGLALAEGRFAAGKLDLTRLLALQHGHTALQQERLDLLLEHNEAMLDLEQLAGPTEPRPKERR